MNRISYLTVLLQVFALSAITALPPKSDRSALSRNLPLFKNGRGPGDVNLGIDQNFLCPGYGVYPHPQYCELYYTCYYGEPTYLWHCNSNWLFDLTYNGCNFPEQTDCGNRVRPDASSTTTAATTTTTRTTTTTSSPFTCPANGFYPINPNECSSQYYNCVDGVAYIQTCPGGGVFDPIRNVCVPADQANCGFVCPEQDGFYPIPGQCTGNYYSCVSGVAYERTCPGDSIFDPEKLVCVPSGSASCSVGASSTVTSSTTSRNPTDTGTQSTIPTTTTTWTTTTTKAPGSFSCPNNLYGVYPDPDDCHFYYECISGTAIHRECPAGLYYNPNTKTCDYPDNVPSCPAI